MSKQDTEQSLKEKMDRAYELAGNLAFVFDEGGHVFATCDTEKQYGAETSDLIWYWCEGHGHSYYKRVTEGRCSIDESITFNLRKWEARVDRAIKRFTKLHFEQHMELPQERN